MDLKYVMKQIDLRRTSDRDKMSAQQEAQLLKNLKHPNIVIKNNVNN